MSQMLSDSLVIVVIILNSCICFYQGYRYAHKKGHDAGYKEAEAKYKQPTLTTEQQEVKQKREKVEDHFNRLFAYSPTRR